LKIYSNNSVITHKKKPNLRVLSNFSNLASCLSNTGRLNPSNNGNGSTKSLKSRNKIHEFFSHGQSNDEYYSSNKRSFLNSQRYKRANKKK